MRTLLGKKRKEILNTILGTGSGADIKFLKKIILLKGFREELDAIKHSIENGISPIFRQWQTVPAHLLEIHRRYPGLIVTRFINVLGNYKYQEIEEGYRDAMRINQLLKDIDGMGARLAISHGKNISAINKCASLESLRQLHDAWVGRLNQRKNIIASDTPFPDPPLPGNEDICPITTDDELMAEGFLMHHCVGGYDKRVQSGESYIYRVLKPERATLEIKGFGKSIRIGQFKLAYNQHPSEETYAKVSRWIEDFLRKR